MDTTTVTAHENGVVRLFRLSYPLAMEIAHCGTLDAFCRALGIAQIDAAQVQQVKTPALDGMSVTDFLRAGYEVNDDDIAAHAPALDALEEGDHVLMVVRSSAFQDRPVTLTTSGDATLVATLREPGVEVSFDPLPNPDPAPAIEDAPQKKRPSDAAIGGRVATIVLLLMALLVWLMIWIAG